MFTRISLLLAFLIGSVFATAEDYTPTQTLTYKQVEDVELELHVFTPEGHQSTDSRPAIVFFFGGGWSSGTPKQFFQQAKALADLGMVAIAADYRVFNRQKTSPFESVADAKSAIRYMRRNAADLGIDPSKIVASGGSAGGHIAACTGVIQGYDEAGEDLSISSVPNAMVLFNPVIDTTENGYGLKKVGEERKFEISPAHNVRSGIVPTLIFHGTADKTVPFENAERFHRLMLDSGNHSDLVAFEGKGHGFFNGKFFRPKTKDTTPYEHSMAKTISFLLARGFISENSAPHILRVASPFTNHMVLQRDQAIPVWGKSKPHAQVTVDFLAQRKTATADANGEWKLELDATPVSNTPSSLNISIESTHESITLNNVLVGDVWICSGQSNMQMGYRGIPDIRSLDFSEFEIRTFTVKNTVAFEEKAFCEGEWTTAPPPSAVAASFAYHLTKSSNIPVGIIQTSWGSSSLEAWMPRDMVDTVPHFKTMMEEFDANTEANQKIANILEGPKPWSRQDDVYLRRQSNILYNAMMAPLAPYACKGLVWYQGERNTQSIHGMLKDPWFSRNSGMLKYGDTLKKWIQRYRKEWNQADMEFLIVMLPGYGKVLNSKPGDTPENPDVHSWAWMRESQLKALELPSTAVANTIDLGDIKNIHPKDKLPIGQRLALLASPEQNSNTQGPMVREVEPRNKSLIVHFNHATGLKTLDGDAPTGFWIADESGEWIQANARIKGQSIILKSDKLNKPIYVRYAFAAMPKVNLVNEANLPAYPFRSDRFNP